MRILKTPVRICVQNTRSDWPLLGACLGNSGFYWREEGESDSTGISKTFRDWSLDQALLLPPSVHDFVPTDHLSRFVGHGGADLSAIVASYKGEKGQPPNHPAMMVSLFLYAYCGRRLLIAQDRQGVRGASGFVAIVALQAPDFHTVSGFRRCHLSALSGLFVQVLKLCAVAGLVKLGAGVAVFQRRVRR
jgi:hypothetical protein